MATRFDLRASSVAAVAALSFLTLASSTATAQSPAATPPPSSGSRIGVQGVASVGVDWPSASKSFEAASLSTKPIEVGGAGQVTGLWRDLFAQVSFSRISDTGERAFIAD